MDHIKSQKNAQNILESSIELTKRTMSLHHHHQKQLGIPFNVSNKASKNCKKGARKKTVKALFHLFPPPIDWERAGEIEFFCHPCNAYWTLYALGWYIVVLLGDGDPNFTYAPSPSSCR